jgi:hypothetical protein
MKREDKIADNHLMPSYDVATDEEVEFTDVCMTTSMSNTSNTDGEAEEVYASFPSAEEVRTSVWVDKGSNKDKGKGKKYLKVAIAVGVLIAILIGVIVGVSSSGGGGSKGGSDRSSIDTTFGGSLPSGPFEETVVEADATAANINSDTSQQGATGTETTNTNPNNPTGRKSTFEGVFAYMINAGVSDSTILASFGTPQFRAGTWLAEQDGANMAVPTTGIKSLSGYKYMTRYVMAVLFFSTDGINWDSPLDFMTEKNVCDWNASFTNDGKNYFRKGIVCEPQANLISGLLLGK